MIDLGDDISDIVDIKENDGSDIMVEDRLLCECLTSWAKRNLSRPSLSVFARYANENDVASYEVAIGKAVLNEIFVDAIADKIAETLAEDEVENESEVE